MTTPSNSTPETPLETELKIPVADFAPIRSALEAIGATLITDSQREINLLLDSPDGRLSRRGCVLCLRSYGERRLLTFKGPPSYEGQVKTRTEHELGIEDLGAMSAVLEELGYVPATRYEKDREVWRVDSVEVVLDHTPMGDFLEVEGPPDSLEPVTLSLGLEPSQAVRGSYLSLWQEYRETNADQDLPVDMVFAG